MATEPVGPKLAVERAAEHIIKVHANDAKIKDRDLQDRLLKQARTMQAEALYEEASADAPEVHKRPALAERPGGFTQMPAALKQAAAQSEYYHTFSGIFPQIHRAWMTIDHVLFLWDYTDPRGTFYQYDGLDQTIVHASLVRPRRGVFEEGATPQWLLLLSTPVEVILLGLYTSECTTDIDIHETGFSVPTDGANLLQLVGTPAGRVFMAGADGFLYELSYGTTRGWLDTYRTCAKRCKSRKTEVALHFVTSAVYDSADPILDMAYDSERGILYTLSRRCRRARSALPPQRLLLRLRFRLRLLRLLHLRLLRLLLPSCSCSRCNPLAPVPPLSPIPVLDPRPSPSQLGDPNVRPRRRRRGLPFRPGLGRPRHPYAVGQGDVGQRRRGECGAQEV